MRIARIVSGGQSGADRAALDAAVAHGRAYGGWCPAGGWAEDLPDPPGVLALFPYLWESTSSDPAVRTRLNVRDSHATLVVRPGSAASPGTDLAVRTAIWLGRPRLVTDGDAGAVLAWLAAVGHELTLNVAGPRESEQPGAQASTRALLDRVLAGDR